jgi:4-hydroxy-3-methylbut-2-enyl diphosphate reductase
MPDLPLPSLLKAPGPAAAGLPPLDVYLAAPRGFCAGVRRAIAAVEEALAVHGPPVYVRRAIVHNMAVVRTLQAKGAVFVEELGQVPDGAVVLLSAHGVSRAIAAEARTRGLRAYDAVCPLVEKVHREVARHHRDGRKVVLIGHVGHPEVEGTLGQVPRGAVAVIRGRYEVATLGLAADSPVAWAVQTTCSADEAAGAVAALEARFANLVGPRSSDICYATTNRQAAVKALAPRVDALIVAGDRLSSNAARLVEVARAAGCPDVALAAGPEEMDWGRLRAGSTLGVTAAASTPESVVQDILRALGGRFALSIEEIGADQEESVVFKPLKVA